MAIIGVSLVHKKSIPGCPPGVFGWFIVSPSGIKSDTASYSSSIGRPRATGWWGRKPAILPPETKINTAPITNKTTPTTIKIILGLRFIHLYLNKLKQLYFLGVVADGADQFFQHVFQHHD